ncbi:MAG TPA: hypothetical protein VF601_00420 [Beijerinckiaceae bacterium]|jgi:hypothetical protein
MSALMPRRGQRLAYERDDGSAPLRRFGGKRSKARTAVNAVLLAGLLAASGGGAFLGAHYFLAAGDAGAKRLSEPKAAALPLPSAEKAGPVTAEPAVAAVPIESAAAGANDKAGAEPAGDPMQTSATVPPKAVAPVTAAVAAPVTPTPASVAPAPTPAQAPAAPAPLAASPAVSAQGIVQEAVQAIREAPREAVSTLAIPRDEVEAYLAKGERMLKAGDVAAARLFFGRAAEAGESRGALAMARTYDPEVLRRLPVYGMQPNPAEAARWYAKAKDLGAADLGATAAAR